MSRSVCERLRLLEMAKQCQTDAYWCLLWKTAPKYVLDFRPSWPILTLGRPEGQKKGPNTYLVNFFWRFQFTYHHVLRFISHPNSSWIIWSLSGFSGCSGHPELVPKFGSYLHHTFQNFRTKFIRKACSSHYTYNLFARGSSEVSDQTRTPK